jgi:uncharacterized protein (TIGR02996 family)
MLHTPDEFLSAIEAAPADRTRRLVFADWLDEHDDSRGELIRVEEEMRELPVFADRFWELKPRRNALRVQAGSEWCGRMRYGTECEPVFRHGIPDGWRERWRLIREFTERWHRIPMPDVGGRQAEIDRSEVRAASGSYFGSIFRFRQTESRGRLPASMREWIAFLHDVREAEGANPDSTLNWSAAHLAGTVPGHAAASLWWSRDPEDGRLGDMHFAVRFSDFHQLDPPVCAYHERLNDNYDVQFVTSNAPWADSVSAFALDYLLSYSYGAGGFVVPVNQIADLRRAIHDAFPCQVQFGVGEWSEADGILIRLEPWLGTGSEFQLIVRVAKPLLREQAPDFLWEYARRDPNARGIFAA